MSRYTQVTYIGMMVALALVLQLVEGMIPIPFLAPGVKLGLANMITMVAIIYFGFRKALLVVGLRTFMSAFLSGRLYSFLYSGAGALVSVCVMGFVYWRFRKHFSVQGVSILGAVAHNIGQIAVASLMIETVSIFTYLPILMVSGVVTGYLTGLTVSMLQNVLDPMLKGKFSGSSE